MKIAANVLADDYYIRDPDPDDTWDIGERGLSDIRVEIAQTEADYGYDVTPKADGTVCVLVEHYGDGCTFGNSEYAEVKGVFTDLADAELYANSLNTNHGYFGWHIDFLYFTEKV